LASEGLKHLLFCCCTFRTSSVSSPGSRISTESWEDTDTSCSLGSLGSAGSTAASSVTEVVRGRLAVAGTELAVSTGKAVVASSGRVWRVLC